jgi:hypothetical protein
LAWRVVGAEERHDADDLGAVAQRDRERPAQPRIAREHRRRQHRLLGEVRDPQRQVALPHAAGEADVGRDRDRARRVEVLDVAEASSALPDVHAAQGRAVLVDLPQLADVPALVLTDDAQDDRRRLGQAVRPREHARDDVLQRQQPLRALALGDLALERRLARLDGRLLARGDQQSSALVRAGAPA